MSLLLFVVISIAVFALLQFRVVPALERRYAIDRSVTAIQRIATLTVAEFVRNVALMATVSGTVCGATVLLIEMTVGSTPARLQATADRVATLRRFLLQFSPVWSIISIVFLVLALGIYSHRRSKVRLTQVFRDLYATEFERLALQAERGELQELPSDEAMRGVEAKIEEAARLYSSIDGLELPAVQKEALKAKLSEQVGQLYAYRRSLDLARRVSIDLDPAFAKLPEPETRWEKFQALFISRGLIGSLDLSRRAIYMCSMFLFVPSFLGVVSVPGASALEVRSVRLRDLIVQSEHAQWLQTKQRLGEQKRNLSAEDRQVLQNVARQYETRLASHNVWSDVHVPSAYELRSRLVSNDILTEARKHSTTEWSQYKSGSKIESFTALEREVVRVSEQALVSETPVGREGARLVDELADVVARQPSLMERLRTEVRSITAPAAEHDISRGLLSHIGGALTEQIPGPIGEVLSGAEFRDVRSDFAAFHDAVRHEFISDLLGGANLGNAYDKAEQAAQHRVVHADFVDLQAVMRSATEKVRLADAVADLGKHPAGVEVKEQRINVKATTEDLVDIRSSGLTQYSRNTDALTECVATYRDWFPAQPAAEQTTLRGRLIALFGNRPIDPGDFSPSGDGTPRPVPGGGTGGEAAAIRSVITEVTNEPKETVPIGTAAADMEAFNRARNYSALTESPRVGGVLIGSVPEASWKIDVKDIRWQLEGRNIRFILVDSNGHEHRSRLYRAAIAYQALNYAADGRATAVTILTANPLDDHKVHLHPTLVDTPLGQRIIKIDNFVNDFTLSDGRTDPVSKVINDAHEDFYNQNALYQFVWAERIAAADLPDVIARIESRGSGTKGAREAIAYLQTARKNAILVAADSTLRKAAAAGLIGFRKKGRSVLRESPAYYDAGLVSKLDEYANATRLTDLEKRFKENPVSIDSNETLVTLLNPPPRFTGLTGVRQKEINPNIDELIVPDGRAFPQPFDFLIQFVFTSPPIAGTKPKPWELSEVQPQIEQRVFEGVAHDPKAAVVLADAREFAIAQNLFRMALTGHLGDNFPVEKLSRLSRELSRFAPKYAYTPRWQTRSEAYHAQAAAANDAATNSRVEKLRRDLGVVADRRKEGDYELAPLD